MAKVTPTTKTCDEICRLLTGYGCNHYNMYVQTTFDPVSTHALYGVPNVQSEIDYWKGKVKSIGGKYIRVVGKKHANCKIICFALEITPQEAIAVKMKKDAEERMQNAIDSKLTEINLSILLMNAGATSEIGKKRFAHYLLDGTLDPLLPFESYVWPEDPKDKDERRIRDIVNKANAGHDGCVGMVTTEKWKMIELATQMNKKITDEDKRDRRKAACLTYGLKFLAECFTAPTVG